jgi:hypothetical protein
LHPTPSQLPLYKEAPAAKTINPDADSAADSTKSTTDTLVSGDSKNWEHKPSHHRFIFHEEQCCRRYHVLAKIVADSHEKMGKPESMSMVEIGVNNAVTSA